MKAGTTGGAQRLKILVMLPGPDGCSFYRLLQPAAWLTKRGHEVHYFTDKMWHEISAHSTALLRGADAILLTRHTNGAVMDVVRDLNPRAAIIYDLDDDLLHLPVENQARVLFTPEVKERIKVNLALADAVTVSTEPLAEALRAFNENMVVVPNAIDPALHRLSALPKSDGTIRVGWAGSVTHVRDVQPAIVALTQVMAERPNVRAVVMGQLGAKLIKKLDPNRTYWQQPVVFKDYYKMLHGCGIDIGLAPIRPNAFNDCKSDVKWLEYSAVGAAVVASDFGPYRRSIRHGVTGLLAEHHNVSAWKKHILTLVDNVEMRRVMVIEAREFQVTVRHPRDTAARLESAIEEARERKSRSRNAATRQLSCASRTPRLTIAVPSWAPHAFEPKVEERVADLMQSLPRALGRVRGDHTKVVIFSQGSCEQARAFLRDLVDQVRHDGLDCELITSEKNFGVHAVNEIYKAYPAEFLMKLDDDVLPVVGFDTMMVDIYQQLEARGEKIGMLSLDPAWGQTPDGKLVTFGTRDNRAVVARTEIVSGHEVNWLLPRSTAVGMCRLKRAEKFWAWGGHPELMYGTDQICADRATAAGFENAHFLPRLSLRPGGKAVAVPLIHCGSTSAEAKAMKREQLHKMHVERGTDLSQVNQGVLAAR